MGKTAPTPAMPQFSWMMLLPLVVVFVSKQIFDFENEEDVRNEFVKSTSGRSACKCIRRAWVHSRVAWTIVLDNHIFVFDTQ